MPEPRYCDPLETANTYAKYPGDPAPFCDYTKGYFTTFADWGAAKGAPMSGKEPYEVQPETWRGVFACCAVIGLLIVGAIALSVIMPLVFHGR